MCCELASTRNIASMHVSPSSVLLQRVGQLKGRVNIDSITAVEFVDESAFSLPHTFQVRSHPPCCACVEQQCTCRVALYQELCVLLCNSVFAFYLL